jgi:hypothetical protein
MPKLDEGAAYAKNLARRMKSYVDMMLAPFLRTRVQIYVLKGVSIDRKNGIMMVKLPNGQAQKVILGANTPPNLKRYPHVRVLYDSRTHIMYYDDVVPEKYAKVTTLQ